MRANIVTTSTGIQIGGAYVHPPPQPGHGMECVQAWLLPEPVESRFERIGHTAVVVIGLLCAAAVFIIAMRNNLPGAK
jgi:hypothetical protein